jgi:phage-related minor tail protein
MLEPTTVTYTFDADTTKLRKELDGIAQQGVRVGNSLSNALVGVALKGQSLGDVLRNLAQSLSQMALRAAFKPLDQAFASILNGIVAGGGAAAPTLPASTPVPFARGGVIATPQSFALAGGRTGIAGEAGPEAIMPLARGPDGRLGVTATNTGASPMITFNVSTPDAESFRRSETQIAALLTRTVARGQRNL